MKCFTYAGIRDSDEVRHGYTLVWRDHSYVYGYDMMFSELPENELIAFELNNHVFDVFGVRVGNRWYVSNIKRYIIMNEADGIDQGRLKDLCEEIGVLEALGFMEL